MVTLSRCMLIVCCWAMIAGTVLSPVRAANQAPNAVIAVEGKTIQNGTITVQTGETVTFNGSGSSDPDGDPLTYQWSFGDGQGSTQINPVHTYAAAGTYIVQLTVDDGQTGSAWSQYTANPFTFPIPEKVFGLAQFFVADLNGDGLMDFSFRSATKLYCYDHYGTLMWSKPLSNPQDDASLRHEWGCAVHGAADVDGDGQVEIVALDKSNQIHVFTAKTGAPERTIALPVIGTNNRWAAIAVANLRGNGDRDVILQTIDTSGNINASYINRSLLAWNMENSTELWRVVQDDQTSNGIYEGYWGVSHGPFRCADVDGDGRDEVVGGNLIEEDGTVVDLGYPRNWIGMQSNFIDHLDAVMIGDFRPDIPGLEWVVTEEDHTGATDWNVTMLSKTQGILFRKMTTTYAGSEREPQNVAIANFDPNRPYDEVWVRSRTGDSTTSQHPWLFDSGGIQFASYQTATVLPAGFNTNPDGNARGIEFIFPIDWTGGAKRHIAAKARHVDGNIGVFDALTGAAVMYTPRDFPATQTYTVYVADVSGDSREEVIINDLSDNTIKVYWNPAASQGTSPRPWTQPHYKRLKQNWNYYSP